MYWNDAPKRPAGVGKAAAEVLAAVVTVVVVEVAAVFVVAGKPGDIFRDGWFVPIPPRS